MVIALVEMAKPKSISLAQPTPTRNDSRTYAAENIVREQNWRGHCPPIARKLFLEALSRNANYLFEESRAIDSALAQIFGSLEEGSFTLEN
jgi:hypothetical protein